MSKAHILIVEDMIIAAQDIQRTLERLGYTVLGVISSGEEAIRHVEATRPDLVLMDIGLSGQIDGIKAAELIRDRFDIPVVYLTAYADEDTLQRAKITEPFGYIVKPFSDQELWRNIEIALYKHKMEKNLKEHEQWLAITLYSIGDAVIVTDNQEKIQFMNPIAETLTGWKREDAVGKDLTRIFHIIDEETRQVIENPTTKALCEGVIIPIANHALLIRKDGTKIPIDDSAAPIKDEKEHIFGAILVFHDIIERKRIEQELKNAKKIAEAANNAKSEFLANMSHELRTPLNAILGYAQIFSHDESLAKKQCDAIRIIQRSGEHLLTLANDILDLSKIEAQKLELEMAKFPMLEFLNHLVEMVRIRAYCKGISFITDFASDIPKVIYGDQKRLQQILLNLLGNAIKFTQKGGVTFRVTVCSESRSLRSDVGGPEEWHSEDSMPYYKHIRFQVEDTGIGIPPERLTDIFLPFYRVHDRRILSEGGAGLGLTIAQKLVQTMGSELYVKSPPGQGTTFWFDFDSPEIEDKYPGTAAPSRRIIGFKGSPRKILIADHSAESRAVLKEMLWPLGFEILEAVDGHDTLKKLETYHPDVILIALMMPELDGFKVTRHIRQLPALNDVIVIGVSVNVSNYTQQKALQVGCHAFLPKPILMDNLLEHLRIHLNLEWIYAERDKSPPATGQIQGPIIPPPKEELSQLHDLANIGDIMGIQERIQALEEQDLTWKPFVDKIYQLAEEFKIGEIQEFIEQFIEEKEDR